MATKTSTPSKDHLIPGIDEMHRNTRYWLSETGFWFTEIESMKSMPRKYLERLSQEDQILQLRQLMGTINGEMSEDLSSLNKRVIDLKALLAEVLRDAVVVDVEKCRAEYSILKSRMDDYRDLYETTKMDLRMLLKQALRKRA